MIPAIWKKYPLMLGTLLLACWLAAPVLAAPPNIVFIMTDDQAPWAIGCSGNDQAVTPHLDELFKSGAYLKNAFTVTPVCSPSRASLLTSRYGSELGITDWINPRREPTLGLAPETPAWPQFLSAAGYKTGLVGKWHLGLQDEYHPSVFGYQTFMGFRGGGNSVKNPKLEKNGEVKVFEGLTMDILTDNAIAFVKSHTKEPFALSLHYRAPHAPWLPVTEEDGEPYTDREMKVPHPDYPKLDTERVKRMMREYLSSVRGVDRNVGRFLAVLDELKLSDNTIVIFTSDHGYNMGHNGIWHKGNGHWVLTEPPAATANIPKNQRPNMYDNSIRVPTAIRWPSVIKPGTVIEQTVTNLDWFPTLLSMAEIQLPADVKLRGRNIVPVLKGETPEGWDNNLYAEYSTHHQSHTHMRMIRTPKWKYIRDFLDPKRSELYNLQKDPEEQTNLIDDDCEQINAKLMGLSRALMKQMRENNDPVLKLLEEPSTEQETQK